MLEIKSLDNFVGKYRVICPYHINPNTNEYEFMGAEEGVNEWDYFIPLNCTDKQDDWNECSNLYIYDKENGIMAAYIKSTQIANNFVKMYKKYGAKFLVRGDGEATVLFPYEIFADGTVSDALKIMLKGRNFAPKSIKNLPTYNSPQRPKETILNQKKSILLKEKLKEKYRDNKIISAYRELYKAFDEKYNINIPKEAKKQGITAMQFIDNNNLYDKLMELI